MDFYGQDSRDFQLSVSVHLLGCPTFLAYDIAFVNVLQSH